MTEATAIAPSSIGLTRRNGMATARSARKSTPINPIRIMPTSWTGLDTV